jgi:hypothetical protein
MEFRRLYFSATAAAQERGEECPMGWLAQAFDFFGVNNSRLAGFPVFCESGKLGRRRNQPMALGVFYPALSAAAAT